MARTYRLGRESFATKDLARQRVSAILNAGPIGSEVTGLDVLILYDLLALRTDKQAELQGRSVQGFVRGIQPGDMKRTRCFWAVLDNETRIHFSVYKALRLLEPDSQHAAG
ncbi:DUF3223 domain-containing protein [Devosia albogilva]|uniref:DUF3223 domain-containing protein n=1 Tax=Devosia albogilva TaxID=429726 RepID=A0ABW5QKJ4_9HYPH